MDVKKSSQEEFYQNELIKKALDIGILKELESTDDVCICNISNIGYVAFIYIKDEFENQMGILINDKQIKQYLKDKKFFDKLIKANANYNLHKFILDFNEEKFNMGYKYYQQYKDNPKGDINLELENELLERKNQKQ